jgi:hypothetical protein
MKSLSKFYSMFVIVMFLSVNCNNIINNDKEPFLTSEQRTLIRTFATQNGYAESVPLDSFVIYLYREWPYQNEIYDFFLTFPIQDTIPRTLVLTDVLTQLGKGLRVHYMKGLSGVVRYAYIDSIEIRTDSVIVLPSLGLEYCNLTHLPATIGNVRTKAMNIRDNPTIQYLPNELMRLTESPEYYDTFVIKYDKRKMDPSLVSDTLKNWLNTHAAPL